MGVIRQIFLDTETTGLQVESGHRIIEVGCVEMLNREFSGRHFHYYLQPDRAIDEEAVRVHGITTDFLKDKPRFKDVADEFLAFVEGAEIIIHNAPFDVKFLNAELSRLSSGYSAMSEMAKITDSLVLARQKHPGQKNSLDKLCERYGIDNQHRTFHGALKDALLLGEVYRAMTGGQIALALAEAASEQHAEMKNQAGSPQGMRRRRQGKVIYAERPLQEPTQASPDASTAE